MSFEQDPDEQANISGADLAILVDENKALRQQLASERAVSDRLLDALKDAAADLRGYESVEDSAQRDRLIAEVTVMRKEKPE